ncbi:MAG: hypothetical protein MJZ12_00300 [Prevotella sp.]|nr:hypothetical protein [Prevotella sp.]
MITEEQIDRILEENERRWVTLRADYDPITGEGAPGERVKLEIPDFAIPVQYVPKEMMKNTLVKKIVRCKTIAKFIEKYGKGELTYHDVELSLRRIRHKHDFLFWAYFCIRIKAKVGGMVRFKLNLAQLDTLKDCEEMRLAQQPIGLVIDKARQWGGSTFCIFYQAWILFKWDNYHSFVVAAHIQSASETIVLMLKNAMAYYPAWDLGLPEDRTLHFAPAGKAGSSYMIKDDTGTQVIPGIIYIGTVKNPDSIRSKDISGVHYSEVGVWDDTPERRPEDVVADISGGMLKKALTMQVMESTAKTQDDYFHEMYTLSKKGKTSYRAKFIGWQKIIHDTLEINDVREFVRWLLKNKDSDVPENNWKSPGKYYWWLWTECKATLQGINWYRYKELDFTTRAQMMNEAPSNDIESFVAAGNKVFDFYQVEAMRKFERNPYKVGRLISNDRRDKGVLEDIKFIEQANGNLKIWEMPDDTPVSYRYLVSVDIGGANPTSDFHSVRVIDRLMMMPEFNGRPSIVAEMHYHCQRDDLAYDAMRLAEWYNHALLVIESNTYEMTDKNRNVEGDGSQYILDIAGEIYTNLYARETKPEKIGEDPPKLWGFHTGPDTKPKIIDLARWAIAWQKWEEPCTDCLDEFALYIEEHNKFTAPAKKHDDELMATCIGLWVCFREMPHPKWIEEKNTDTYSAPKNIVQF